jgi:prolyl-tRNA editing enzyme YbaK/EbsC (Cys-tRNA(Pro) deacylase)
MSAPLPEATLRVQDYLKAHGCASVVVELPGGTRTAAEAARAVGCDVAQIANSIVFRAAASGRPVLVVASGAHRVDEATIARLLGEPVEKAAPDFVRESTGFAIGGVPPVAHAKPPVVFVDEHLLGLGTVWAAAGTPMCVFPVAPDELVRLTGGAVARVAQQIAPRGIP